MLNFAIFAIFSIISANKTPSDNWNLASEIRFSTRLWEVEEDSDPRTRPARSFFFFLFPESTRCLPLHRAAFWVTLRTMRLLGTKKVRQGLYHDWTWLYAGILFVTRAFFFLRVLIRIHRFNCIIAPLCIGQGTCGTHE